VAVRRAARASSRPFLLGFGITLLAIAAFGVNEAFHHHALWPAEGAYADYAKARSLPAAARGLAAPAANRRSVAEGRIAYLGACAACHGSAGKGDGPLAKGLFPTPTDLRAPVARARADGEIFTIIRDGLSFTGMPAFKAGFTEAETWSLVAYLRALQAAADPGSLAAEPPPTPSAAQLAIADPRGDPVRRGAAIYFAEGCALCHGAAGDAAGELAIRAGGAQARAVVRHGRNGMPAYGPERLADAQLDDLVAYLNALPGAQPDLPGARRPAVPPPRPDTAAQPPATPARAWAGRKRRRRG
jgi:mono/diheme cytochrome c family protein